MELQKPMEEIIRADEEIKRLNDIRKKLLQNYADMKCPYKIGDTAICKGYSHKGKKVKITKIILCQKWNDKYEWAVKGLVIKKDGKTGAKDCLWKEYQENKK